MSDFESNTNINSSELNSTEVEEGINIEREITSEELEKSQVEQEQELSPEDNLESIEDEIEIQEKEVVRLTESIKDTKAKLNEVREKLNLPPTEEEPPSIFSDIDKIDKLKAEQDKLEKQKEGIVTKQEKEQLINEEKEKILQEKIDEIFEEFNKLSSGDIDSILKGGKTLNGQNVEIKSMGSIDPEVAQSLVKAFKEGIKLLPRVLEILPDLMEKFDEDLIREATERVEKKLEDEQVEQKPENIEQEEESVLPEEETASIETEPEINLVDGESSEISKI